MPHVPGHAPPQQGRDPFAFIRDLQAAQQQGQTPGDIQNLFQSVAQQQGRTPGQTRFIGPAGQAAAAGAATATAAARQPAPTQVPAQFIQDLQAAQQQGQTPEDIQGFFGAVLQNQAATNTPEFQAALAGGRLDDPRAQAIVSQGLAQRGNTLQDGQVVPQTGLIGSEFALQRGLEGGVSVFEEAGRIAREDITGGTQSALAQLAETQGLTGQQFEQGAGSIQQFVDPGAQAQQLQSALSGAQGQEAFNQAFIDSPQQAFLNERGERALTRNAAAIGGLGGGNVRRELVRFGQGNASLELQRQIDNLNALSGQGLQAAGGVGALRGQQAGVTSQIGQAGAQQIGQGGVNLANIATGAGLNIGGAVLDTAGQVARGRTRVGEQIADAIGGTTSNVADLINQQGAGLSDITGVGASNLANVLNNLGQQTAGSQEELAQLLANIQIGQAGQVGSLPGVGNLVQSPDTLGQIGALSGGIGTLLQNLPEQQQQQQRRPQSLPPLQPPPPTPPIATINTGQQFAGFA